MFKYLLSMLLTFVIGTSTVALSQDYYCYRESGSTVELTVQDSRSVTSAMYRVKPK